MDNRCIAICDSGAGGLRLLKRLSLAFPNENFIYYGDYENLPYGNKTQAELIEIARANCQKFTSFSPKLIVFACNTLTTNALSSSWLCNLPVLGTFPSIIEGRGLLLCTNATANSSYVKEIMKMGNVEVKTMDGLAEEIESGLLSGCEISVYERLKDFDKNFDFISLGCTHYPYLTGEIRKIFPNSRVISGEEVLFDQIEHFITTFDTNRNKGEIAFIGKGRERLKYLFNHLFLTNFK